MADLQARIAANNQQRQDLDRQIQDMKQRLADLNLVARQLDAEAQPNVVQGFVGDAPAPGVVAVGTKNAVARGAVVTSKKPAKRGGRR